MAIKYTLAVRVQPRKKTEGDESLPRKYYAVAQSSGVIKSDKLCEQASATPLGNANLLASLPILSHAIETELLNGNIVDLGPLGRFSLTLKSKGTESPHNYNPHVNVKEIAFHWEPGWNTEKFLQKAEFKRAVTRKDERIIRKKALRRPDERDNEDTQD
ncbi:MAG: hypothetical protein KBT06_08045 [Prevotellaceae bacterium]|nr:hypothetical protein [Candidatus Colivivens equi]